MYTTPCPWFETMLGKEVVARAPVDPRSGSTRGGF
jgi:hypothetical protein